MYLLFQHDAACCEMKAVKGYNMRAVYVSVNQIYYKIGGQYVISERKKYQRNLSSNGFWPYTAMRITAILA